MANVATASDTELQVATGVLRRPAGTEADADKDSNSVSGRRLGATVQKDRHRREAL